MWLVPFQAAWSAGHALHGHLDATAVHGHDDDHQHDDDLDSLHDEPTAHHDDNHHGSHGHAAFSFLVADAMPGLIISLAAQPPPAPPASFRSHIPLLPDPPPALRI